MICIEAYEDKNENISCTKCKYNYPFIWSEEYNQSICDNKCAFGFFFREKWCYECDNPEKGNIGCNSSAGCDYVSSNNELQCNSCKPGYFVYLYHCLKCSSNDIRCIECHLDKKKDKFQCDKCIDEYYVNNKTGKCEIITYDEYPEVTPGCILSINNYTDYIKKNKCLYCKPGFFKTKNESCIYCRARKNGGPSCKECEYIKYPNGTDSEEIRCKRCNDLLSQNKRCFNCKDEVGPGCSKCIFEDGKDNLICEKCENNYKSNNEGFCTNIQSYYNDIPHCAKYNYS